MVSAETGPAAVMFPVPGFAAGGPTVTAGTTAPALPTGHVQRRRLFALLDAGVRDALTLVSAPAGAGKTVLVSSWLAAEPSLAPVGWVWDDPGAVPGTMWHDLVEILGNAGVAVPVLAAGAPRDRLDRAVLASLGSACGESPRPLVVVLESEAFAVPDMGADLDFLLRHSGGQLRLVLVTRADPVAPLHRYRLAETMLEIRTADLAFTAPEARELLSGAGVELSAGAVEQLMLRTKGWAAGLRFAALFLSQRGDPERAVVDFTGDSGTVAEYLLAEVLNAQSADVRRMLLLTSVVDVLRPGLVDALAGTKGRRALSLLMRVNTFVEEVPGRPGEYAYHPIFRELLRAELGYESPASVLPLHMVAADWLFAHGLVAEAVQHAVAAGAWDSAASYVVDSLMIAELLLDARSSRVAQSLAELPSEVPGAPAALVRAASAQACSDGAGCDQELATARAALDESGARSWAAELTLLVIRLAHTSAVMDVDAGLEAASAAESTMNQHATRVETRPQLVSLVHRAHGDLLLAAGDVDAAVEAFTAGTVVTNGPGSELLVADSLGALALVAARLGHARQAVTMAERALRYVDMTGNPTQHGSHAAEVALAWVELERYNVAAARRHVKQAERCRTRSPASGAMLTVVQARLSSARGDLDGAVATIRQGQRETDPSLIWPFGLLALELSSLELLSGHPDQAAQTVAQLPSDPEHALLLAQARQARGDEPDMTAMAVRGASSPLPVRVRGWLLEASRLLAIGRDAEAVRALERSLRLAEPERLRRPFREAPKPIRRLLRQHSEVSQRHRWLGTDLAPAAGRPTLVVSSGQEVATALVVEPLTERELEVLGYLAKLLTTQEIAGEMFLSVNTIRTHVRNILRKLSASRRNEAVRRARELRII